MATDPDVHICFISSVTGKLYMHALEYVISSSTLKFPITP